MFPSHAPRIARCRLLSLGTLALIITAACQVQHNNGVSSSQQPQHNVILVLVDTLRANALGCYGAGDDVTPVIDGLAATGVRCERAYSQSSWTGSSVASMLTSRWPHEVANPIQGYRSLRNDVTTIAELFSEHGYTTAGFIANALLQPDSGFAQGFTRYWVPGLDDEYSFKWVNATEICGRAADWLEEHQQGPFFLSLHLLDPHSPYCPPQRRPVDPNAAIPGDMSPIFLQGRLPSPTTLGEWQKLYAEEVALADREIGRLLEKLDPVVRQRTIIAFVADHGEEFAEHGFIGHGWSLYDELIHVPMIITGPGVPAGEVLSEPVALVDLLPTLAELAALPADSSWRGRSLLSMLGQDRQAPANRLILAETASHSPLQLAVLDGSFKAVLFNEAAPVGVDSPAEQRVRELLPRVAVYNLHDDPGETDNLSSADENGQRLAEVRDLLLDSLGTSVPGSWTALRTPLAGERFTLRVRYPESPSQVTPLFFQDGDRFRIEGSTVTATVRGGGALYAWLLTGNDAEPTTTVQPGQWDSDLDEVPWQRAAELAPGFRSHWLVRPEADDKLTNEEQQHRLRALGYLE